MADRKDPMDFVWLFVLIVILSKVNWTNAGRKPRHLGLLDQVVKYELVQTFYAFERKERGSVSMTCKGGASERVTGENPFAAYRWEHNNGNFKIQPLRMVYGLDTLTINSLVPLDSGTYHCQMQVTPSHHVIVALYSLIVGNRSRYVDFNDEVLLKCHSEAIGKVYTKAVRFWTNPKGKVEYIKMASNKDKDVIPTVTKDHEGLWMCQVKDIDTGRIWTVDRVGVTVGPLPSPAMRARKYVKRHPYYAGAVITGVMVVVVSITNFCTDCMGKRLDKKGQEMKRIKEMLDMGELDADDEEVDATTPDNEAESKRLVKNKNESKV